MRRGQSSVEFIVLLSLVLMASSLLIADLDEKSSNLRAAEAYSEARAIAMKTAYNVELVSSDKNITKEMRFPLELDDTYTIRIGKGRVNVLYNKKNESFTTAYKGDWLEFNTSKIYDLRYEDGVKVD